MSEDLRYPIGKFEAPVSFIEQDMLKWVSDIRTLPGKVRNAVMGLTEEQLATPYRMGGWTIKQVVHHLADSHMNAITRIKLALTEDNPTIKPYHEADWALLPDYDISIESSLKILEGVHLHMVALFETFTENEWSKAFYHPDKQASLNMRQTLANYAWHGKHHLAHITNTTARF